MPVFPAVVLLAAFSGLWTACHRPPTSATLPAPDGPLERTVEGGPVKLTVRVDRNRITIADKLNLTVEVTAREGVDVQMPRFGDRLDEFHIRDFRDFAAIPTAGGRIWRQQYVLDILVSGEYQIPPLRVRFIDRRATEDSPAGTTRPAAVESEVQSEPLTVQVGSLLQGEFDPARIRDIRGPVALPAERSYRWLAWTAAVLVVLAGLIGLLWWWNRRTAREAIPLPVPAHVWAGDQFLRLREDRLIEQGLVRDFYFRLTDIVRGYIERRFAIMAAEQTTDEFLAAARDHPALGGQYRVLLGDFLRAGDLVKFALYRPDEGECRRALALAEQFVEQTAERESPAAGSDADGAASRAGGGRLQEVRG